MNLPIGQLIQGASQARNAFVGGQQERQHDDLAQALMARKLAREDQEQSLRDALTRRTLNTPIAQPRDYVKEHETTRDYDIAHPMPTTPTRDPVKDHAANREFDIAHPTQSAAPRRDPVKDHMAIRDYDVAHPTQQQDSGKPTEFSNKAALVYPRAAEAAQILDEFFEKGVPATSLLGKVTFGQYGLSPETQRANQAAETVASAVLRLESGAAISDHEVKSYARQFLPQPGDSKEVREQKRASLQTQLERMRQASGPTMARDQAPPKGGGKITPAERTALKAKGFTDAQINARYGPP